MFTGYGDVFYYWANKMLLITIQTSPGEFASIGRQFLISERPFLIISFSQEDLAVIACMLDILPSLIYIVIVLSIELISHHIKVFLPTINLYSQVNPTYENLLENNEKIKKCEDKTHECVIFLELGKYLIFWLFFKYFLFICNRP